MAEKNRPARAPPSCEFYLEADYASEDCALAPKTEGVYRKSKEKGEKQLSQATDLQAVQFWERRLFLRRRLRLYARLQQVRHGGAQGKRVQAVVASTSAVGGPDQVVFSFVAFLSSLECGVNKPFVGVLFSFGLRGRVAIALFCVRLRVAHAQGMVVN